MYDFLDESFEVCNRISCLNQDLNLPLGEMGLRMTNPNDEPYYPSLSLMSQLPETNSRLIAGGHSEKLQLDFIIFNMWPTSDDTWLYLVEQLDKRIFVCHRYQLPSEVIDYHSMKMHLFGVYPTP